MYALNLESTHWKVSPLWLQLWLPRKVITRDSHMKLPLNLLEKILSRTLSIVQNLTLKVPDKKFSFKNLVTGKLWLLFQIPMLAPFRDCVSLSFLHFSIAKKLRAKFATQSEQWYQSSEMTYYLFSCFWFPLTNLLAISLNFL